MGQRMREAAAKDEGLPGGGGNPASIAKPVAGKRVVQVQTLPAPLRGILEPAE